MQRLGFLADNLLKVLASLLAVLLIGIIITCELCADSKCSITDWLQVWVAGWGFIFATTTFLAAWIDANRKPNLKFNITSLEAPPKPISQITTTLKPDKISFLKFHIGLENASPEPARFIKIEIELQSLNNQIEELPPDFQWNTLVNLHVEFADTAGPLGRTWARNPTTTCYWAFGGNDIIIYARDKIQSIAYITITTQGNYDGVTTNDPTTSIVPTLHEHGLTDLHYALLLRAFSDKQTTEKRIPLTVHLQPE
jgi:hypothetical protein